MEGDSARKEAVKGKLENDVEDRNALIGGGEAGLLLLDLLLLQHHKQQNEGRVRDMVCQPYLSNGLGVGGATRHSPILQHMQGSDGVR